MGVTLIRTIVTMGTPQAVRAQRNHVAETLQASHPRVAETLRDLYGRPDRVLPLPARALAQDLGDQPQIERLSKEVERRIEVVGVFPNADALLTPTTVDPSRFPKSPPITGPDPSFTPLPSWRHAS